MQDIIASRRTGVLESGKAGKKKPVIVIDDEDETGGFDTFSDVGRGLFTCRATAHTRQHVQKREDSNEEGNLKSGDSTTIFTLSDIHEYTTRKRVAGLMAISPGIPVSDLYNLLGECGGLSPAEHWELQKSGRGVYEPHTTPHLNFHHSREEEKRVDVKIDYDDPIFIYDTDMPNSPPVAKTVQPRKTANKLGSTAKAKCSIRKPTKYRREKPTQRVPNNTKANIGKKRGRKLRLDPNVLEEYFVDRESAPSEKGSSTTLTTHQYGGIKK
ncbi:hypothetical protein BS50DRAFT_584807 [Corynespora cassiicola Philippines]|uniref:Uncharacterized protein n=1 Tax=Corynespora cassiicola Philippines TaxID=1448308 RepID=A0A2T2P0V1_CORCC|nr:hypothetical protein BS50DRAFT_584807 [Corynespora cassiicola Philippines]